MVQTLLVPLKPGLQRQSDAAVLPVETVLPFTQLVKAVEPNGQKAFNGHVVQTPLLLYSPAAHRHMDRDVAPVDSVLRSVGQVAHEAEFTAVLYEFCAHNLHPDPST
jgi:hypothetical protein